ncbi:MAG: double-strand break repair protein AddB [Sulfitobacter sp.]|nr:double-strand break repair protein AddB [Sulfitobacter sp.]
MFDPQEHPRVFGLAPGVDFPAALVEGLCERLAGQDPLAMADVELIVNTRRMERRLQALFAEGQPGFLPRIHLLTDLHRLAPAIALPPATPALRRRLELTQLVARLLEAEPDLAPRTALYGLADSLASLFDEMQGEGVTADDIAALDVSHTSGHWARAQKFIAIADAYLDRASSAPDPEARQRALITRLIAGWQANPPSNPVILAGSTGSRGTTALLMEAVARLPQGAVILPGFDEDLPTGVWQMLDTPEGALPPEDHPQYRFRHLMQALGLPRAQITPWHHRPAPSPARNRLVSLSLRPAPVTHAWLTEGPHLTDLAEATAGMTLLEAPSPRAEALAIAMRLRKAAAEGKRAALITPDRMLTRQVSAALDRWNILPDDSAGTPLQLSPPGRFLRHVADLFLRPLDAAGLLTLLKHPLTHTGTDRGPHGLFVQRLEARIRRDGLPFPDAENLRALAAKVKRGGGKEDPDFQAWAAWVADTFTGHEQPGAQPLSDWVMQHRTLAERIAAGATASEPGELWKKKAGDKARALMDTLATEAPHGGEMRPGDYADLLGALLSSEEVRDRDAVHPRIMIWGTLEARVQGADLVILGGLNDGTWPEAPAPDPWLNRLMRAQAGLLLPERRIGLSAHDYQQAIAAPEVWLSRAIRSEDAETVPSRWLNRLGNLLTGLPQPEGAAAWNDMRARGADWIRQTEALEAITPVDPAPRPAPCPPRRARFTALSVTEIKRLIRDPYAIYARHTLGLRAMNPLVQSPDAPLRGIILHAIMERFIKDVAQDPALLTRPHLLAVTEAVLEAEAPWPAARIMWRARIARIADWFIMREAQRQQHASPAMFEKAAKGTHTFKDTGVTLTGYADRIDRRDDGQVVIYDYKTGKPPSPREQAAFDKQLLLEAAILEEGGFAELGIASVADAVFIGLGATPAEVAAPLEDEPPREVLEGLRALIAKYLDEDQGFTARRMMQRDADVGDFDHLARYGEWDTTKKAKPERLT